MRNKTSITQKLLLMTRKKLTISKFKNILTIFICLVFTSTSFSREVSLLKSGWKFSRGEHTEAFRADFDDSGWTPVTLPHDWAIGEPFIIDGDGNTGKLPWKGQGWYRHELEIPSSYAGKQIYLMCDGIMAFPKIYINGKLAGEWDYGYNSFHIDITPYIKTGSKNILAIHVDTRKHDSRWYPGAGIYRKIQMIALEPAYVDIWGTQVTTPIIKPNYADVYFNTTVVNQSNDSTVEIINTIISPEGIELAQKSSTLKIPKGKSKTGQHFFTLTNPQRWDLDNPALYKVKTEIKQAGKITDMYVTKFGVRSIRFTPDHGLYLNDKRVQLKGVNLHHGHGPLGAAFYKRAMQRQLEIMKDMGCNAIRTSHNIPAPELLELCDEMGLLVFNEAFDKYDRKADITRTTDFDEFAHRNMRNFVKRDRNHPSVFIWSVGNEMHDVQQNENHGFQRLNTMITYVKKYDPTRPVTMANDMLENAKLRHFDLYDVHSWNYNRRYRLARQMAPNKPVIISESASTVSTRGFYELPLPREKTDFTKSLQISSYDLNAPNWAEIADDDFMWQQDEEYIAGEFVWTGFDYLGEPTPYANYAMADLGFGDKEASRSSYFGIVDLCGIPKDRYYLYKSYWKPEENTIHILPHWNWKGKDGHNIPVFIYTNGDCAELFLNGKSLGKKCKNPKSDNSTDRFRLMWNEVSYEPGELKALAYKEGKKIGEQILRTAGEIAQIKLTPDRDVIHSGGNDLSYILIEAYDTDGNLCPLADNQVQLDIKGPGFIAGVGNGNPQSFSPFHSEKVNLFFGKAMLILGSKNQTGDVSITAKTKGIKTEKVTVKVQ